MQESDPLLLHFAASRPVEFAALMVDANLSELDELICALPPATAAEIVARLPSRLLSELLVSQAPAKTGEMLIAAKHDDAVALVSYLHESQYPDILAVTPKNQRSKINRLFEFPFASLSAVASPEFIRVTENVICESFCAELAAYEDTSPRPIFVVDEKGIYVGVLNVLALIATSNEKKKVGDITDHITALSGEMTAPTALKSPHWLQYLALPVIDGKQRILGSITRSQLHRMVSTAGATRFGFETMLSELAQGYLNVCAEVLESSLLSKPK